MALSPRKLARWFAHFMRQGDSIPVDVRLLCVGDSTMTAGLSQDQGSFFDGVVGGWSIPVRADGGNPIVGLSANGPDRAYGAGLLDRTTTSGTLASGWATSLSRNPRLTYTTSDGQTVNACPQQFCDHTIAAANSRTGYVADGNQTGIALWCFFGAHVNNSARNNPLSIGFGSGGCPWTQRQTHTRWIGWGAGATRGRTDMRIQGVRGLPGMNAGSAAAWTLANVGFVGSKVTMDHSPAGGVLSFSVDCGAGAGVPGFIVINPNSSGSGNNCTMLSTGARCFRSDGSGNPIAGVHMASIAIGGNTLQDIGRMLGIGTGPYVDNPSLDAYLQAFIGGSTLGVNAGPTHVLLQVGYNFVSAEVTANNAGDTSVYSANVTALIQAIKAAGIRLNNMEPEILVLFSPARRTSYTRLNIETAERASAEAAAAEDVSFYSLLSDTDPGTSNFEAPFSPSYTKSAAIGSVAGTTSGPVPGGDFLHPSRWAQYVLARRIWEAGCVACGYQPISVLRPGPLPELEASGGKPRRGRWR